MNRLILLVESRIRGDVYVRFGGEHPKTHRRNTAGRRVFSLQIHETLMEYDSKAEEGKLRSDDLENVHYLCELWCTLDKMDSAMSGHQAGYETPNRARAPMI